VELAQFLFVAWRTMQQNGVLEDLLGQSTLSDAAEARAEALQQLYRDWQRWRGTRALPSRSDVDPVELRYILGELSLVAVSYDPLRFFYRVHATASAERIGFDLTGKSLDALSDEAVREAMRVGLTLAVERRAPLCLSRERVVATKEFGFLEVMVLPLSSDGEVIDMLLVGAHFHVPRRPR
jgi:hypothetical protein